jgi:hypothetical protein
MPLWTLKKESHMLQGGRLIRVITVCGLVTQWIRAATLTDLASTADSIVVGLVSSHQEDLNSVEFSIAVERVLKGESISSIHVLHKWTRGGLLLGSQASATINVPLHGLWFLKHTEAGGWDILPVGGPPGFISSFWSTPATLPQFYQSLSAGSLTDALVILVASGIELHGIRPAQLIGVTGSTNTPALQAVFLRFVQMQNPQSRSAGLAGMLWGSQSGSVGQLIRLWPTIQHERGASDVIRALRNAFRDPSPDSVIQLGKFAAEVEATSPELHHAAIWALSAIHSKETLPFLSTLLASSSAAEQARGVFGLSSFANGCPPQTLDNTTSMEYLQFINATPYRTPATIAHFAFGGNSSARDDRLAGLVAFWVGWWNQHPELH